MAGSAARGSLGSGKQRAGPAAMRRAVQAFPHPTRGEDLTEAAALDIESRRAALTESVSMVHRTLGRFHNLPNVHEPLPWRQQITWRSVVLGALFGAVFSIITHKLNLTSGVIPSMGIAIALVNFFTVQSWNAALARLGFGTLPFTPQENAVMQTCVGSVAGLAFTGGFGSYLIAMDHQTYLNLGSTKGNSPNDVYNPELWRTIPYLLCISLIGIFILLSLRKRFIVDYALPYPSGMASGVIINSLHSIGNKTAERQMRMLGMSGITSFGFALFKWFFSATGDACGGFSGFPTLGLKALKWTWSYDFSLTYIGVGMICPHIVNVSMLLGSVITWGFLWPFIDSKAGDWFPAGLNDHDFSGLFGYKVFIAMAVFLGDGLYNFAKIAVISMLAIKNDVQRKPTQRKEAEPSLPPGADMAAEPKGGQEPQLSECRAAPARQPQSPDSAEEASQQEEPASPASPNCEAALLTQLRNQMFLHEAVPWWVGAVGYLLLGIVGAAVVPLLYPAVKWYMVVVCFLSAPVFSVCNAYGAGLTDWDVSSLYGKLCIFAFSAWAGKDGGVTAGLAVCGIMLSVTSAACGLMGDFKTGWVTLCSARSMFVAQVIGSIMGCVIAPLTFLLFYKAFDVGVPGSAYPAPYATIYRAMAILGIEGVSALPQHCLALCAGFFLGAMFISALRDVLPPKWARLVPIPMAAAIPFYIGAQLAVDMCIGSVLKLVWERKRPTEADAFVPVAASGLIAGEGLWTVPAALLAIGKINPPICMSFGPAP